MIELGSEVRDKITGLTGIVTARTEWLYGCQRVGVQPRELHDGKPLDAVWFDEAAVEIVELEPVTVSSASTTGSRGGPRNDPTASRPGE